MNSNKYTLDRLEGELAVFIKYPDEIERLHIPISELDENVKEGDIVLISIENDTYKVERLVEKTEKQREKVQGLLENLKNQRK
ncbi:DUF3006 domain-containing protein [Psychrobacillus sp. OK032]|uniref:DUF3006 domain-containing protein n=1 Tax=Psychrobacillus sp. OK032 TaxID=1884358 RepID=UPI0008AD4935|nr:DUF3006 domain-containing protein [Psychrobacillus sp. OK032]SES42522.1 chromosome segregation protein [Psychrobacillus sp. OK032]